MELSLRLSWYLQDQCCGDGFSDRLPPKTPARGERFSSQLS